MTKISDLTALTGAGVDDANDLLTIVDMSEAGAARNKKITIDETRIALGLSSTDSPQFTALNLGHASDTTITRVSAGVVAIEGVNIVTTAGGITFAADISVPDEAYDATAWNGSLEVPTKNAVRDKIEALSVGGGIAVEDEGVSEGTGITTLNFTGAGVSVTVVGSEAEIIVPSGGGGIDVEDEGVSEATGATILNFAGAGVTAADVGGGQVDVTIPGGGASYEASPTVPDTSGYTLQQTGGGSASMANANNSRGIVLTFPTAADRVAFVRKNGSPPSTPYTLTLRAEPVSHRSGGTSRMCIILRNNTSGRLITFGKQDASNLYAQRWASYTSTGGNILLQDGWFSRMQDWLQIHNDGTTLTFRCGPDGENWFDVTTEALATYIDASGGSVDEIGFGATTQNAGFTVVDLFQSFTAA